VDGIPERVTAEVKEQVENEVKEQTSRQKDQIYSSLIAIMSIFAAILVIVLLPIQFLADLVGRLVEPLANGSKAVSNDYITATIALVLLGAFQLVAFMFFMIRSLLWERGEPSSADNTKDKKARKRASRPMKTIYLSVTVFLLLLVLIFGARSVFLCP
jgi:Na+/H+ antiporter NhaD/arsenite permease-like protein